MKVVLIHTSPVSLNDLKALFKEIIPEVEMVNIIDDSLLEEVKKNGQINSAIISRMCAYVQVAKTLQPDLIFNQCSSVGEAFDIARKQAEAGPDEMSLLIFTGLVLFVLTFVINALARLIVARTGTKA